MKFTPMPLVLTRIPSSFISDIPLHSTPEKQARRKAVYFESPCLRRSFRQQGPLAVETPLEGRLLRQSVICTLPDINRRTGYHPDSFASPNGFGAVSKYGRTPLPERFQSTTAVPSYG